jgi:hypothetical protein
MPSWPTMKTWSAVLVTVSDLNTYVRDVFNVLITSIDYATGFISGRIKNFTESLSALTISAGTLTVDFNAANVFPFTLDQNISTTTAQNPPASGVFCAVTFIITFNGTAYTWAWLTSTVKWPNDVPPVFTNTAGKIDTFMVWTVNGGSTWRGVVVGQNQ